MMGRALSQNGQKDSHFFSFRNIHDFRFFTISTIPGPWDGSFLTKVIFFFFFGEVWRELLEPRMEPCRAKQKLYLYDTAACVP